MHEEGMHCYELYISKKKIIISYNITCTIILVL